MKQKILIGIAALSLTIVSIGYLLPENYSDCPRLEEINLNSWLQDLEIQDGGSRFEMANTIKRCDLLLGETEANLISKLGEPQRNRMGTQYNYWLRFQEYGVDSYWLTIWLSDDEISKIMITGD